MGEARSRGFPGFLEVNDGQCRSQRKEPLTWYFTTSEVERRRWESNPCTGLCRPLPEPLGHVAVSGHAAATRTRGHTIAARRITSWLGRRPTSETFVARPTHSVTSGVTVRDRSTGLADRPSANPVGRILKLKDPSRSAGEVSPPRAGPLRPICSLRHSPPISVLRLQL